MIERHAAGAVNQSHGWNCTDTVNLEILFADGDGSGLQSGIELLPDPFNVGQFFVRFSILAVRLVSVEGSGRQQNQTACAELGLDAGNDRTLCLAVRAPV